MFEALFYRVPVEAHQRLDPIARRSIVSHDRPLKWTLFWVYRTDFEVCTDKRRCDCESIIIRAAPRRVRHSQLRQLELACANQVIAVTIGAAFHLFEPPVYSAGTDQRGRVLIRSEEPRRHPCGLINNCELAHVRLESLDVRYCARILQHRTYAMIDIETPDGQTLSLVSSAFIQVFYADHRKSDGGSDVVYDGGHQVTPERAEDIVARISDDVSLIALNIAASARNGVGFPVWINVDAIGGVRSTPSGALLIVGGRTELVTESRIDVIAAIKRAKTPGKAPATGV